MLAPGWILHLGQQEAVLNKMPIHKLLIQTGLVSPIRIKPLLEEDKKVTSLLKADLYSAILLLA